MILICINFIKLIYTCYIYSYTCFDVQVFIILQKEESRTNVVIMSSTLDLIKMYRNGDLSTFFFMCQVIDTSIL